MTKDISTSTALFTDKYELTMLEAALRDSSAYRQATFEVFARKLPHGRRYGVVCGTGRFLSALEDFFFTEDQLGILSSFLHRETIDFLRNFSFIGDIDGYREGDVFFPNSPILTVRSTFAHACIIETLLLSIFNHDCAIASAAARMSTSARKRILIEMGSRRTHEQAAVAAARAAYIAGFSATSNLAAADYGIPTAGTAGHAFTLLYTYPDGSDEKSAFRAQIAALGVDTTLLVDTYDITQGVKNAIEVAGPQLGAVRIDSGDLGILAHQVRAQLDSLGAKNTKIVVSGDLDEYSIAALQAYPIDIYGVGTSLVTGSGVPTAGLVYKLVDIDGIPVAKRARSKRSIGGIKRSFRLHRPSGTLIDEVFDIIADDNPSDSIAAIPDFGDTQSYVTQVPLMRKGKVVCDSSVEHARKHLTQRLFSLPWEALSLAEGDPAFTAYHYSYYK